MTVWMAFEYEKQLNIGKYGRVHVLIGKFPKLSPNTKCKICGERVDNTIDRVGGLIVGLWISGESIKHYHTDCFNELVGAIDEGITHCLR